MSTKNSVWRPRERVCGGLEVNETSFFNFFHLEWKSVSGGYNLTEKTSMDWSHISTRDRQPTLSGKMEGKRTRGGEEFWRWTISKRNGNMRRWREDWTRRHRRKHHEKCAFGRLPLVDYYSHMPIVANQDRSADTCIHSRALLTKPLGHHVSRPRLWKVGSPRALSCCTPCANVSVRSGGAGI